MMDKETVLKVIELVEHPAINATLQALGILSKVEVTGEVVKAEFALPFANIPIKGDMISSVQILAESFGFKFLHTERLMTEEEKKYFLEVEKANWKGGSAACSC